MPKVDLSKIEPRRGSGYPGKLADQVVGRANQAVGDAGGITQFGANITTLEPGALSSLRHYHMEQDEFAVVLTGVCTLVDDHGEHELHPGECAAFPKGDANGHHFINKTDAPVRFLIIGTRTETETAYYSDVDMKVEINGDRDDFTRKDGSPLTAEQIGDDA